MVVYTYIHIYTNESPQQVCTQPFGADDKTLCLKQDICVHFLQRVELLYTTALDLDKQPASLSFLSLL